MSESDELSAKRYKARRNELKYLQSNREFQKYLEEEREVDGDGYMEEQD